MSWGIQARLTPAGIETAKQVASRLKVMLNGCTVFGSSPLIRAQETAFVIMAELGIKPPEFANHIYIHHGFWSTNPAAWYLDCKPEEYSNGAVYKLRPKEVESEGHLVLHTAYSLALQAVTVNQNVALAVSHGGPLDAAIMVAKRSLGQFLPITDLEEGEGAIFTFDGNSIVAVDDFLQQGGILPYPRFL